MCIQKNVILDLCHVFCSIHVHCDECDVIEHIKKDNISRATKQTSLYAKTLKSVFP